MSENNDINKQETTPQAPIPPKFPTDRIEANDGPTAPRFPSDRIEKGETIKDSKRDN